MLPTLSSRDCMILSFLEYRGMACAKMIKVQFILIFCETIGSRNTFFYFTFTQFLSLF
ncbi:unnamed protein product [Tenebrio molitor]|nr:unnamed protein product [Tenebrio molitor]